MMLARPCHPVPRLKTYGEECFQLAGPKEWNDLPLLTRLKTYLLNCAFN